MFGKDVSSQKFEYLQELFEHNPIQFSSFIYHVDKMFKQPHEAEGVGRGFGKGGCIVRVFASEIMELTLVN